ncbi:glycosyltransferase [Cohnella sp. CFH 77786]|nr:glycosyltransferase [Cohnella sp. CFH 77786]
MKVCIVIPAFNEEKSIYPVIRDILQLHPDFSVLVVNDGSSDRTAQAAKSAGAHVITLPQNLGIGGAVQTGYRYAAAKGFDVAIQVDADGQHKPGELNKILEPIRQGAADMVIGSRFVDKTGYRSTIGRRTGIRLLSALITLITRQPLKDVTSGFRAANRRIIDLFAEDYSSDYPEVDSLVMVKKRNFRILEVPVEMEQRQAGRSSITALKSAYYMIKVSLSIMVKSFR